MSQRVFCLLPADVLIILRRLGSSISYDKQTGNVRNISCNYDKGDEDTIVITNFRDKLYALFKKDKETWDEDDTFL
ncbi:hypothetical protein EDC94DRAFT_607205, partial [Helicostylum pulchrum]